MMQLLGKTIPYVEVRRGALGQRKEEGAGGNVDCNVIMMGYSGNGRIAGQIGVGDRLWGEGGGRWEGNSGAMDMEGKSVVDETGMAALRCALKAGRRNDGDCDAHGADDDDGAAMEDRREREELKGVGVHELTQRMLALHEHEQQQQQQQQHASTGINVMSYLNTMRFNRSFTIPPSAFSLPAF